MSRAAQPARPLLRARPGPRRVALCEPSPRDSAALRRLLEHDGSAEVVGLFATAAETIAALPSLGADLLVLSSSLAGMTGLDAVEEIMSSSPLPIFFLGRPGAEENSAALSAGALETAARERVIALEPGSPEAADLRRRLELLSRARVIRHPRARLKQAARRTRTARRIAAIGVCASTGGPQALVSTIRELPADYPIPILVVQHIADGFTETLVRWLSTAVGLPVRLAAHDDALEPGVSLAPAGSHLVVDPSGARLRLCSDVHEGSHTPSGDVLFHSLARAFGPAAAAVVLTGMGRDGARGLASVRSEGGLTIAQSAATSAIFGMPKAALESGAELTLGPAEIGAQLVLLRPVEGRW
jgi:two-component system chemotaxis response regulator CheB